MVVKNIFDFLQTRGQWPAEEIVNPAITVSGEVGVSQIRGILSGQMAVRSILLSHQCGANIYGSADSTELQSFA